MADSTELKHRIRSIKDTHQITKAMELISISKLRKVIQKQSFSSIYFDNVWKIMAASGRIAVW